MARTVARRDGAWAGPALLALAAGALVPLAAAGPRGVLRPWWALSRSGTVRVLGAVLCAAALLTVPAPYAAGGLLGPAALRLALWAPAVGAARAAVAPELTEPDSPRRRTVPGHC